MSATDFRINVVNTRDTAHPVNQNIFKFQQYAELKIVSVEFFHKIAEIGNNGSIDITGFTL